MDVGVVCAVQHEVHRTDTQHGEVGIETMEHTVLVVVGVLTLQQFLLIVLLNVFGALNDEASTAHSGVTDGVLQGGLHHLHHHTYDVPWCTELPVVA